MKKNGIIPAVTCGNVVGATCWCGFLKMVQQEIPELLEQTIGLRRTSPFYAMLFDRPAVHYARGVQRDSYARIDLRG